MGEGVSIHSYPVGPWKIYLARGTRMLVVDRRLLIFLKFDRQGPGLGTDVPYVYANPSTFCRRESLWTLLSSAT
jgi:hypothetical protein